ASHSPCGRGSGLWFAKASWDCAVTLFDLCCLLFLRCVRVFVLKCACISVFTLIVEWVCVAIHVFIYMCVCVCVCVWSAHRHVDNCVYSSVCVHVCSSVSLVITHL